MVYYSSKYKGADGAWWLQRSSKPSRGYYAILGGFDSYTLPPQEELRLLEFLSVAA